MRMQYACADIGLLRERLKELESNIERRLQAHEIGRLLTTIDGIGHRTAACLIGEVGDPARFRNPWLRAHYQRLCAAGKSPKVALVACMRKLLTAVYSVARSRRPFVPHIAPQVSERLSTESHAGILVRSPPRISETV